MARSDVTLPQYLSRVRGKRARLRAIEEAVFARALVNVTPLFSSEHYIAAGEAYMRGTEPSIAAGHSTAAHQEAKR